MNTTSPISKTPSLRTVFFISDGTGLTAQSYGSSLLAQFPDLEFVCVTLAFVDTVEKAQHACIQINNTFHSSSLQPVVFSTLVGKMAQLAIEQSDACTIDLFHTFLGPLENCFNSPSAHTQGNSRTVLNNKSYRQRLDAIDYALAHDDGLRTDQYDQADIILVGVSRCGKTPTSLYLAMNFSLKVSNYPLVEDDLQASKLADCLLKYKNKLFAITIKPVPLSHIRRERRPNSDYASLEVCQHEINTANALFSQAKLPIINSTEISIEEVASHIVKTLGISRKRSGFI